jgi:hypothetical protein
LTGRARPPTKPPKPPNILPPEPALKIHRRIPIISKRDTPVLPHHTIGKDTPVLPPHIIGKDTPVLPPRPRVSFGFPLRETAEEVLGEYTPFNENVSDPGKRATSQQTNRKQSAPSESGSTDSTSKSETIDATQKVGVSICHSGTNQQLKKKDNNKVWPPSLISILQQTMATPCYHPSKPLFEFDMSVEAAKKNYMILMHKFGGDLHKALRAQQGSPLQYGSEFKPVLILAPIFKNHPTWNKMTTLLTEGSMWPLSPIDEHNRLLDIDDTLAFGNHKGANQQPELLRKLINDDVTRGFALPLPRYKIKKISGVLIAPLNI